jgi:solute carrier family 31 (copper transporter), member 1
MLQSQRQTSRIHSYFQAYLILATVVGAALGHYIFNAHMDIESVLAGGPAAGRGMACH